MNREIKFRAWDKLFKKMIYVDGMKTITLCDDHSGIIRKEDGEDILDIDENTPLMQYTGLKDKNGKEIYEGDLIRSHNKELASLTDVLAVKYSGCSFVIYNPNCCDVCKNGGGCICNLDEFRGLEVIGNIYENPELIKD